MIPSISEEKFAKEFETLKQNMEIAKITSLFSEEELMSLLKEASAGITEDTGLAFKGSLICHINLLCAVAKREAAMVSNTLPIDIASLYKVCILIHLSKAMMFIPQDNEWFIKNRGEYFKFADLEGKLKGGERSFLFAANHGVTFTPTEMEAMLCLDKDGDSKVSRAYDSTITLIVRISNEIAYALEKNKNKEI